MKNKNMIAKSKGLDRTIFKNNIILSLLLICLKGVDLLVTLIAIPLGAIETIPISAMIIESPTFILSYYFLLSFLIIFVSYYFYIKKMGIFSKMIFFLLIGLNIISSGIIINNLFVLYGLVN